ncbi:PCI domain-containing protein [Artemisia annua]|uniref:PCI domain-containing protein n=1 Tax=Artemisia annua TaxID=35608 RepID=A0A2U1QD06_ARTAN|nr:PCI domain-containing protein [Artemisia annua]
MEYDTEVNITKLTTLIGLIRSRKISFWYGCIQSTCSKSSQTGGCCLFPVSYDILNSWATNLEKLLDLVEKSCYQIQKETMIHKAALIRFSSETDASETTWAGYHKCDKSRYTVQEGKNLSYTDHKCDNNQMLFKETQKLPKKLCKYTSGTFKPAEINYTVHEKEVLAIIRTLKNGRWNYYPLVLS